VTPIAIPALLSGLRELETDGDVYAVVALEGGMLLVNVGVDDCTVYEGLNSVNLVTVVSGSVEEAVWMIEGTKSGIRDGLVVPP